MKHDEKCELRLVPEIRNLLWTPAEVREPTCHCASRAWARDPLPELETSGNHAG